MRKHTWERLDEGIYRCKRCGLYRCHALCDFTKDDHKSRRLIDVEYSKIGGEVVALNPNIQPPCEPGIYV